MMSHAFLTEDDAGDNRFRPIDAHATARHGTHYCRSRPTGNNEAGKQRSEQSEAEK